jgi:hypothetical protein
MLIRRLLGDLGRASIIYGLTAFGAAHEHAHGGFFDPVRSAAADPILSSDKGDDQTVATDASCDGKFERDGVTHYFAQHLFERPLSARQLSRVRVLAHVTDPNATVPGYSYAVVSKGIFVREGAVAVECGDATTGKAFDTVTFVTPRIYKLDIDTSAPW